MNWIKKVLQADPEPAVDSAVAVLKQHGIHAKEVAPHIEAGELPRVSLVLEIADMATKGSLAASNKLALQFASAWVTAKGV